MCKWIHAVSCSIRQCGPFEYKHTLMNNIYVCMNQFSILCTFSEAEIVKEIRWHTKKQPIQLRSLGQLYSRPPILQGAKGSPLENSHQCFIIAGMAVLLSNAYDLGLYGFAISMKCNCNFSSYNCLLL